MPTYEYHCDACEHHFDEFQPITAEALKKCPACKKSKLRRVFGAGAAILFKGSGFYQTDYRSESYKAGAKADTEKSPATDKSSSGTDAGGKTATNGTGSGESTGKAGKSGGKSSKSAT
jgi:putative FmdB family regulatory protein